MDSRLRLRGNDRNKRCLEKNYPRASPSMHCHAASSTRFLAMPRLQ
jgi:hypothetical protein